MTFTVAWIIARNSSRESVPVLFVSNMKKHTSTRRSVDMFGSFSIPSVITNSSGSTSPVPFESKSGHRKSNWSSGTVLSIRRSPFRSIRSGEPAEPEPDDESDRRAVSLRRR